MCVPVKLSDVVCVSCCSESHSAGASPSHQTAAASRVNFSSIEELSRSARQPDMEVETDHLRTPPQLAQVISLIRTARDSATFSGRRSPQPAVASPTPPTVMDSLSPRCRSEGGRTQPVELGTFSVITILIAIIFSHALTYLCGKVYAHSMFSEDDRLLACFS